MDPAQLHHLLHQVAAGELSPSQALSHLKNFPGETVGDFARVDHHRRLRTGFPEVVWGQDKTPDQIAQIMATLGQHQGVVMATRIAPEVFPQIRSHLRPLAPQLGESLRYFPMARIAALVPASGVTPQGIGTVGILTAGTADLPVAEEAAVTAELGGFRVERLWDVGVAGIHRLLSNRAVIDRAHVLIVVAGMEGALPSVVAGLADCPVVAVPTSIGYGASFGGVAPLLTMLNSCAAGVGVVNIDNGFGAAILAGQILRTAQQLARDSGASPL